MKNLFLFVFLFTYTITFSPWTNLKPDIDDHLTGIVFFDNNGLVCGQEGRFETLNNPNDSIGPFGSHRRSLFDFGEE